VTIYVPDSGIQVIASLVCNAGAIEGFYFHLYTNDYTPSDSTVIGDFTELTSGEFPGYSAQYYNSFAAATVTGHVATCTGSTITWTPSSNPASPVTIYGYYAVSAYDGTLIFCERFSTPFTIALMVQSVSFVPTYSEKSQY
jgi:hypothetical protein